MKQLEQAEDQEDPDCEPPAPKKKKKKDQVNDHVFEVIDMNGNSNGIETPKQKIKKNTEENTEVSDVLLVRICSYLIDFVPNTA